MQFLAASDLRRRHFEFVRRFLSVLLNLALLLITPLLQLDTTHKIVTSLMTCHTNKAHTNSPFLLLFLKLLSGVCDLLLKCLHYRSEKYEIM